MGWVTERHKCTYMEEAFENLRQAMDRDAGEANNVLGAEKNKVTNGNREGRWFLVTGAPIARGTKGDCYGFKVYLVDGSNAPHILIKREGPSTLPPLSDITITQGWDIDSSSCRLFYGKKMVSIDQICQIALEPMFFERGV